jgi:hypothetical protein
LEKVDPVAVKKRRDNLLLDSLDETVFLKYKKLFASWMREVAGKGVRVYLVMLPTLLGKEPGTDQVVILVKNLCQTHDNITCGIYLNTLSDPSLFEDHDHLNQDGIKEITSTYLKPLLAR